MSKDGDGKTKYEAPVVIALGELAGAVGGGCTSGTLPTEGTCQAGTGGHSICSAGDGPGASCGCGRGPTSCVSGEGQTPDVTCCISGAGFEVI